MNTLFRELDVLLLGAEAEKKGLREDVLFFRIRHARYGFAERPAELEAEDLRCRSRVASTTFGNVTKCGNRGKGVLSKAKGTPTNNIPLARQVGQARLTS